MRSSRQKASFDSKWLVNDPCGTPAARTMSRTVAPQYPCSRTTLKPSVSIFSRSDGLDILTQAGMRRCHGDPASKTNHYSCPLSNNTRVLIENQDRPTLQLYAAGS